MKKAMVLLLAVLFICLGVSVVCVVQPQESFVENEKQAWESQNHSKCSRSFGFAYGTGRWSGNFLSKSGSFDWVAVFDSEGFITVKIDRLFPKRIVKKFSELNGDFNFSWFNGFTTIKILNNDWTATHFRAKRGLQEELQVFCEKTGLEMIIVEHESLR
ncbi:MAG: hypothetical protein NT058_01420 [Candidatus Portnoybacteria bacterium]|nr:hypothetical protein [Candidatus Portnoybacteria bacterium]